MKHQSPTSFIRRDGTLYASVRLHDLVEGTDRIVGHERECLTSVEVEVYRACIQEHRVTMLGDVIGEPVQ